jgi:RimJ/RimL family protein N-acetyltransferase
MRWRRPRERRVGLGDGSEVFVRPVVRGDKDRLARMTDGLSEESRYRRYLGPKGRLTDPELRYLTELDHRDHEALVALEHPGGAAVGVARYIRHPGDPRIAEAAVVVSDGWQRRGVATALLRRLAAHAHAHGVRRFTGVALAHNRASMDLLRQFGPSRFARDGHGTVAIEVDLPAPLAPGARAGPRR